MEIPKFDKIEIPLLDMGEKEETKLITIALNGSGSIAVSSQGTFIGIAVDEQLTGSCYFGDRYATKGTYVVSGC